MLCLVSEVCVKGRCHVNVILYLCGTQALAYVVLSTWLCEGGCMAGAHAAATLAYPGPGVTDETQDLSVLAALDLRV